MERIGNKNKIYVVAVICIGLVASIWLLIRNPGSKNSDTSLGTVKVVPYKNIETNNDWKKMLTNIDNSATETSLISKHTDSNNPDDTTLTAQMSKDFLSQYLVAIKKNGNITPEEATRIAQNTLTLPDYTKSVGAKYLSSNLHIDPYTDKVTLQRYKDKLYKILLDRSSKLKEGPMDTLITALKTENENEAAKLDSVIFQSKSFLLDLLAMEVPKSAVSLHLELLNDTSNLVTALESMRVVLSDPVKGLTGIGQYSKSALNLKTTLLKIDNFFTQNL